MAEREGKTRHRQRSGVTGRSGQTLKCRRGVRAPSSAARPGERGRGCRSTIRDVAEGAQRRLNDLYRKEGQRELLDTSKHYWTVKKVRIRFIDSLCFTFHPDMC